MKAGKTILFLCSWLVSLSLSAQALGDSLLAASLDSLIAHQLPKGSNVGISVYDLTANRMLYEYQADRLSRPASTMKLVTAITALSQPGFDEPFRTEVWYRGRVEAGTGDGWRPTPCTATCMWWAVSTRSSMKKTSIRW